MVQLGIYEKALPKDITWLERLSLTKELGFDFVEMSIDETDERLARLDMSDEELNLMIDAMSQTGVRIQSICLSGHRRYPYGSTEKSNREMAYQLMDKAIRLASKLNIRIIQVAGYDVYYEEKSMLSREYFIEGLKKAVQQASEYGVMLSVEIMDDPFMNSLTKFIEIKKQIPSPYLQVYPDLGNLSAWPMNNPAYELEQGIDMISSIHLKDTYSVTADFPGQFRDVPFGEGCVDFDGLLHVLKRLGYEGTFLIEMWNEEDVDFKEKIKEAQDYLYPKLRKAGYHVPRSTN